MPARITLTLYVVFPIHSRRIVYPEVPVPRLIEDILADQQVSEVELRRLFDHYDTNRDGRLSQVEVKNFALDVSRLLKCSLSDVMDILSFYQHDDDEALDREEVRGFLEIHMT